MAAATPYLHLTVVPEDAVRWPLVLPSLPAGFDPARAETWPPGPGRYEFVGGRLEYMPPCGELQQLVAIAVAAELFAWRKAHTGFNVGGNEAGMLLDGEVRGADAAVWVRERPVAGGFQREAPVLAVEVAGRLDTLEYLQTKAGWYFEHGVEVIWIVMPETRTVRVMTKEGHVDVREGERIAERPSLPGLSPPVAAFFQQL